MERRSARKPDADTIAAIATAPGRGGIGVVRVSGSALGEFARRLTGKNPEPRTAGFVRFRDGEDRVIDAGILLHFVAPHSFTGEDVLELQGHGGPVVLRLLLERCVELGARLARPGEFSQRAFLNGKLDLAQAEAIADLIEAESAAAARSAMRSLSGAFSREVHALADGLVDLRMLVEATLDFPEEEIDFLEKAQAFTRMRALQQALETMLDRAGQGALLRNGMSVVLVGQPNVGKSSLLNALAGDERAIVTEIAGTTRDALRETITLEGVPAHIIDTAGLRDTDDVVERIGVERSWKEIARADVIVRLVDARTGLDDADRAIDARLPAGIPRLTVVNKIDLCGEHEASIEHVATGSELRVAIRHGWGLDLIRAELLRVVGWHAHDESVPLARERHLVALRRALDHLSAAGRSVSALELMAEELRLAHECLQEITGEFSSDDLLGVIFSRFCIGK